MVKLTIQPPRHSAALLTRHRSRSAVIAALALSACTKFEDPDIVVDLRVIAMEATLPEQVIDVDLANPPPADELLAQVLPTRVCALVADPSFYRDLRWSMTLCPPGEDDRCDDPSYVIGSGVITDPDGTFYPGTDLPVPEPQMCAEVPADSSLLNVVLATLNGDSLKGFQGLDYEVLLEVGGVGADPSLDQYAVKTLQLAARVPSNRTANNNPYLDTSFSPGDSGSQGLVAIVDGADFPLPLGRCIDDCTFPGSCFFPTNPRPGAAFEVAPGEQVELTPNEPDGVHEQYFLPTTDGGAEMFTESLTYDWTASGGKFSTGSTGGPRDLAGNPAPLATTWTAPSADDVPNGADIAVWVVQRDERYGVQWYESCFRVSAP